MRKETGSTNKTDNPTSPGTVWCCISCSIIFQSQEIIKNVLPTIFLCPDSTIILVGTSDLENIRLQLCISDIIFNW